MQKNIPPNGHRVMKPNFFSIENGSISRLLLGGGIFASAIRISRECLLALMEEGQEGLRESGCDAREYMCASPIGKRVQE